MPWDLVAAIEHANRIIDMRENLTSDEMPPEWMWPIDEAMVEWMERVADERRAKYGGGGDDREKVPMMENELAKGRR